MADAPKEINRTNLDELQQYFPTLVQILRRSQCPDPENAASEVLLKAMQAVLKRGEIIHNPPAYLAKIGREFCGQQRRKRGNGEWQMAEDVEVSGNFPDYSLSLDLNAALGRLKDRDRKLLLSSEEPREKLASEFKMPVTALTKMLERLRDKVADEIGHTRNKHQPAKQVREKYE